MTGEPHPHQILLDLLDFLVKGECELGGELCDALDGDMDCENCSTPSKLRAQRRYLASHSSGEREIREKIYDELEVLYGESAKQFNEYLKNPEKYETPEGKKLIQEAYALAQRSPLIKREKVLDKVQEWMDDHQPLNRADLEDYLAELRQQGEG
jgi:hypothetical protein